MKKLLTIAKDSNIKVNSQISYFLEPENVYLPINKELINKMQIKSVKKGELLYNDIYSPISGQLKGVLNKNNKYYLIIHNDFREEDLYKGVEEFTTVNIKTNFIENLKKYNHFDWDLLTNIKTIILNGIEDEPYVANKTFLHCYETSGILQMLDLISEAYKIPNVFIYLKETDRESIEAFNEYLGTYPNIKIKILPDYYPIGNEFIMQDFLKLTPESYIFSTEKMYDMYVKIIKERVKDTTFLTITGDAIINPQVFKVKIGTLLKDIVKENIDFIDHNYTMYVNGIMKSEVSKIEDIIITEDIRAIYFMKNKKYVSKDCSNCGKCNEVCPVNCNPYLALKTKGKYQNEKCINCGLCTFICPSYIDLAKYLNKKGN